MTAPSTPTQYHIVPLDPHAHLYQVSVTVVDPDPAGQRFRLPTWIPGSYLIREFARHFVHVRAEAERGEIRIIKEAKDLWRAAPCFGPLTVVAQVYAYDLSVRTAYLDGTRGYFNGSAVFLCPEGREDAPCIVDIAPPDPAFGEWRVATTLPAVMAAAVRVRPLSRGELRRTDRPSGGDWNVRHGNVHGGRRAA